MESIAQMNSLKAYSQISELDFSLHMYYSSGDVTQSPFSFTVMIQRIFVLPAHIDVQYNTSSKWQCSAAICTCYMEISLIYQHNFKFCWQTKHNFTATNSNKNTILQSYCCPCHKQYICVHCPEEIYTKNANKSWRNHESQQAFQYPSLEDDSFPCHGRLTFAHLLWLFVNDCSTDFSLAWDFQCLCNLFEWKEVKWEKNWW